jgi:MoxR-like ATPase
VATEQLSYNRRIVLKDARPRRRERELDAPDRRDGLVYDHTEETRLAVEVALTTGRPLLVRGDPGSGKSSLAAYVARNLNWRYYEHVVTSATEAKDLLWTFDLVRRLSDAQVRVTDGPPLVDYDYVEPGVLWWVFDRELAKRRGASPGGLRRSRLAVEPNARINPRRRADRAVVLIDELDKADPDVPNGLLVPLGSMSFRVAETGTEVTRARAVDESDDLSHLLVVITTNEERDLPPAFVRRCVVHRLESPDPRRLVRIAFAHLRGTRHAKDPKTTALLEAVAERVDDLRKVAEEQGVRPPSTAEYLDAVRACLALEIGIGDQAFALLERATLWKDDKAEAEPV